MIRRYAEASWNHGNLELISEIIPPNHVHHAPGLSASGPEGMKQLVGMFRAAFPDIRLTIEDQIAEGDKVVIRWTTRGTHRGPLMGIAPTNKAVTVTGIDIYRFANGMVEEQWSNWDAVGLMQQLGAMPTPGESRK